MFFSDFQSSLLSSLERSPYSGWLFGAKFRDASDFEWEMVVEVMKQLGPWLIGHAIAARTIKQNQREVSRLRRRTKATYCSRDQTRTFQ
jgi:hypothetical protein